MNSFLYSTEQFKDESKYRLEITVISMLARGHSQQSPMAEVKLKVDQ